MTLEDSTTSHRHQTIPRDQWTTNDWADFYSFEYGVNVLPADTGNPDKDKRKPKDLEICGGTWTQWKNEAIPIEIHEEWKKQGSFEKYGLAIICGRCWRQPYEIYFNGIDNDNKIATDILWSPGLEEKTMIEQHVGNLDKSHMYYLTEKRPMRQRKSDEGGEESKGFDVKKIPIIEIQSGGKLMFVTPSPHRDGSNYGIVGTTEILNVPVEQIEKMVDDVCEKYGLHYLKSQSTSTNEKIDNLKFKTENTNRQGDLISIVTHYAMKNRGSVDEDDVIYYSLKKNKELGESYPEERAIEIGKSCYRYSMENEHDAEIEIKTELKTQWDIIRNRLSTKEVKDSAKKKINELQEQLGSDITQWDEIEKKSTTVTKNKDKDIVDKTAVIVKNNHHFITIRKTNEILLYNGKIYSNDAAESIIKEETESIIENCTTHERLEVVNKIKAQTGADNEEFDADPNLQTIENGILNLKTIELSKHTPSNLSKVLLPVNFIKPEFEIRDESIFEDIESNLKNTLFWKFLKRSFTVDGKFQKENFETILEITASFLIKGQIDAKMFMNLGGGDNGKSVYLAFTGNMIGKDNIEHIQIQDLENDKFMCAKLEGKIANIFPDLEPDELRHTGKIKAIAANEGIEVQNKYQPAFKLYPFVKMMFSCNRFPKAHDQGQGFFRRWIIIKWERNFENDPERDEHLIDKLLDNKDETNMVFSVMVYLARKLLKDGKFTHSKDWQTVRREWNANADPIDDFATNYIIDSDNHKSKRETHQFYKEIILSKGETPLGIGQFGKEFAEYYEDYVDKDGNNRTVRVWLNIDFKKPQQVGLEEFQ